MHSVPGLDVLVASEGASVGPGTPVGAHDLAHLSGLVDPEEMSDKIDGALSTLARHEEITLTKEGLIIQPIDIEAINGDSLILAVDDYTLVPALLIVSHLVAD